MVAVPAAALGARLPPPAYRGGAQGWWPWLHGDRFWRDNWALYRPILVGARLVVIALSGVLGVLVFAWARRLHGGQGGLAALALYVLCPTVVAHGALATLDLGVTLLGFAACFAADGRRAVPGGRRLRLAAAGGMCGCALAAKLSGVFVVPAVALAAIAPGDEEAGGEGASTLAGRMRAAMARLAMVGVCALAVLFLAYGLAPPARLDRPAIPVPLPGPFVAGLADAMDYARRPEVPGYLNGEWSYRGWWYYHLEAFLIKEPLPLLALLALGLVLAVRARGKDMGPALWLAPLLLGLSLATWNRVQYGLRYALPAYPFLFVAAGAVGPWSGRSLGRRAVVLALFAGLAWCTLAAHPHPIAYFNRLVGGPERGFLYLADSNLDWGQDLHRLAERLRRDHPGETVRLAYFGHLDPGLVGIPYRWFEGSAEASGLVAVSASYLAGEPYAVTWKGPLPAPVPAGAYRWLQGREPLDRVGYSIYLYDLGRGPAAGAGGARLPGRARPQGPPPGGARADPVEPGPGGR